MKNMSLEAEAASLRAVKEALSNLPRGINSELVHVQRMAPELVDDDHLVIFLRGANFDVEVHRLIFLAAVFRFLFYNPTPPTSVVPSIFSACSTEARVTLAAATKSIWPTKVHTSHDPQRCVFGACSLFDTEITVVHSDDWLPTTSR